MRYPNLLRRYLSTLIDMVLVLFLVYFYAHSPLYVPRGISLVIAFLVFLSFEPLLTAFACTPGQALMRLRVRDVEGLKRISVNFAYLRALTKYALGMVSFFSVPLRRDRRALHDLVAQTIVIEASAATRN
jgi:uncharacterized RDD family membrane protein YckC